MADLNGILLLDKPLHLSSAGAVARAKYMFRARKAGHTGSLDPLATGMLPICFGEATKFGSQLLEAAKTYRVSVRLGERTPSADLESEVIERREIPPWTSQQMEQALADFPRIYSQVPPMHSALKQGGKPLYEYARRGIVLERAPRTILIQQLRLLQWNAPDLSFDVRCTKGAYIRVLAEDLAASMRTVGHLIALRRLSVMPFETQSMWTFETLEPLPEDCRRAALLPVDAALTACRRLDLPPDSAAAIRLGRSITLAADSPAAVPGTVRIYAEEMGFLGLGEVGTGGCLVPVRLISAANRA